MPFEHNFHSTLRDSKAEVRGWVVLNSRFYRTFYYLLERIKYLLIFRWCLSLYCFDCSDLWVPWKIHLLSFLGSRGPLHNLLPFILNEMLLPHDLENIILSYVSVPRYIKDIQLHASMFYRFRMYRILDPQGHYHPLVIWWWVTIKWVCTCCINSSHV